MYFKCKGHSHGHSGVGGSILQHHHHHSAADLDTIGVPGGTSGSELIHGGFGNDSTAPATEMLTSEQIDAILMRHDQVIL